MVPDTTSQGQLLNKNRDKILAICEKYGAHNVRVFGSVARGSAREDSDIDLLVEMDKGRSLFDLVGCQMEVEELLKNKVDMGTRLKPRIQESAMEDIRSL